MEESMVVIYGGRWSFLCLILDPDVARVDAWADSGAVWRLVGSTRIRFGCSLAADGRWQRAEEPHKKSVFKLILASRSPL
ncbi:hypothetical protein HPP92_018422 [Vanilla planifolia]|uniref:Uncharacterized protein n=1 Tax=Vanilla planifolia TaxID=51239 RepID=A0A835QGC9_VANPL|nr:hypothetical protein HPP92_018422 [Vanilla planifolia]